MNIIQSISNNYIKVVISLICLAVFNNMFSAPIKVILRYDDVYLDDNAADIYLFSQLNEKQIPISLAVISADINKGDFILDTTSTMYNLISTGVHKGDVEVAMHGFSHENFSKLCVSEQDKRITLSKSFLEESLSFPISTFIPPFNSYNKQTLDILVDNEFLILSSDEFGIIDDTILLKYFPCTVSSAKDLYHTINKNGYIARYTDSFVVLMFHAYDFNDDYTIDMFIDELDKLKISGLVEFHTFSSLASTDNFLGEAKWVMSNRHNSLLRKYIIPDGIWLSTLSAKLITHINALIYTLVFIFITLLFNIKSLLRRRNTSRYYILIITIISILIYFITYSNLFFTPLKLMAATVTLAVIIGFIYRRTKKIF